MKIDFRGLFDKIFRPEKNRQIEQALTGASGVFEALTGYQPAFSTWSGKLYESGLVRAAIDARARHISKMELKSNPNPNATEPGAASATPAATVKLSEDRAREIRSMTAAQIETRKAEINAAIPNADAATLDGFEAELDALETRARN